MSLSKDVVDKTNLQRAAYGQQEDINAMAINIHRIAGPAFLAPALVNGDTSGLDEHGDALLDAFTRHLDTWFVVATEDEEGFYATSTFQGHTFQGLMIGYVCHELQPHD